ncbi:MAG: YdcF family protein [Rhodospirillales bacterium]
MGRRAPEVNRSLAARENQPLLEPRRPIGYPEPMFPWVSKIGWFLISPQHVIMLLLVIGGGLLLLNRRRAGGPVFVFGVLVLIVTAFTPTGLYMATVLEDRFPAPAEAEMPQNTAGIVVLGGFVNPAVSKARGQASFGGGVERMIEAARLAEHYPKAPVIFSGGSGKLLDTDNREADHIAALADLLGISESRLILERDSRNTHENALYTRRLMAEISPAADPERPWILVTSAAHMPRAAGAFRAQGWTVTAYPVDYATLGGGQDAFRPGGAAITRFSQGLYEMVGLLAYYLTGKTLTLFPGPEG